MGGHHCQCNKCDFDFCSGHSHHEGAAGVMCSECATEFSLPTRSSWGPNIGEVLELHKLTRTFDKKTKKRKVLLRVTREPTGLKLQVEEGASRGEVHYPIESMVCPICSAAGVLKLDFSTGEQCPKCKLGKLQCDEVEY